MKKVRACVFGLHGELVLIGKELRRVKKGKGKGKGERERGRKKRGEERNEMNFESITNNFRHNVRLYS